MRLLIIGSLLLLSTQVAAQDIFTVHGRNNCGGPANGVSRNLTAGTHVVTLSGAISYWNSDVQNSGNTWVSYMRVEDVSTGAVHVFSSGADWQPTAAAAEATIAGMVFSFDLATDSQVLFHFTDGGGCGDNRGAMTVSLDDPVVAAEPSTWGSIKSVYR